MSGTFTALRAWFLAFSAFLALSVLGRGQSVSATLSPPLVATGQPAEFAITIQGAQNLGQSPQVPEVPGLRFNGPFQSSQMSMINGVVSSQVTLVWQVSSDQPGTYTIPAITISIGGQNFATEARSLQVQAGPAPRADLEPFLKISVAKTDLMVGEQTPVTITLYCHPRTAIQNYEHPKLPRENFVVKRMRAIPSQGEFGGQRYNTVTFESTLSAIRDGEFELGPAKLDCTVAFPIESGASPRFGQFFGNASSRDVSLRAEPIKVTVRPLPAEGKPADFSGAVGTFTLATRATPTQLKVGDPISVDIQVTGQGNFDVLAAPSMNAPEGWKAYDPKVTQENRSTTMDPAALGWNQVIIPQKMQPVVPEYTLSYFDLQTQKYVTVKSPPIPLQMAPADVPPPSIENAPKDFSSAEVAIPGEELDDVLILPSRAPALMAISRPGDRQNGFWLLQLVPLALLAGLIGWKAIGKSRLVAEQRRLALVGQPRACGDIWKDLKKDNLPRRVFYSLTKEYVDSLKHYKPKTFTAATEEQCGQLLQRQSYYGYGQAGPEATVPVSSAEQQEVLNALQQLS